MLNGMSLRHAMLGLLATEPATGYELTAKFDKSLGNAWHASHSQIYPELAKLEAEGMVEVIAQGARNSKTWALTDAGREELRHWLVEVEPSRQQRNESALRLFLAVSGVWFFRVGLMFWLIANRGPAGFDPQTFSGPFLTFLAFAQYLLPLALLELYLRAQQSRRGLTKLATAALLALATLAMAAGIAGAALVMWLPRL